MKNIVYRQCNTCNHEDIDNNFSYLRDGVFACPKCGCKYTEVSKVIAPMDGNIKVVGRDI
jgi:Zn finger protein HypA/HybF involved in hydrogenase expression